MQMPGYVCRSFVFRKEHLLKERKREPVFVSHGTDKNTFHCCLPDQSKVTRRPHATPSTSLLLGLEVVQEDVALLAFLTPVTDDDARAVDDLSGVTLTVEDTETGPFTQHLSVGNLDQGDLVFGAQGNDELLVGFLFAGLVQDAHVCLATIEGLGGFAQTTGETVVDEGNS